ncbi:hypothetical protein DFR49_1923 [Hephaestia caeni]|uniref:Uncharacterized protein n=1 Tax=Hephaestia caeni TaxID=645617 RepID=A0A397P968_9SPHN|nr:hypothetical protein [Hephaestia caeni]RIA43695.1 hypothetical protein DFR49_1923 [Hephaestia caeni]
MKGIIGEALEAPPTDGEGRPVMGIVVGSLGALALWAGILGLISLIL